MYLLSQNSFRPYFRAQYVEGSSFSAHRDDSHQGGYNTEGTLNLKMNPIVKQLLDNIGRLGRELQRVESQPDRPHAPEANNGGRSNVEGEVGRIFRRSSVQPVAQAREQSPQEGQSSSTNSAQVREQSSQQGQRSSTNSATTPRFRLSYNFNNTRVRKKGKPSSKTPHGPFIKDVVLLGGPQHENVPRQGARAWLMQNGHVVSGAQFLKEWDESTLHDFLKSLFPTRLGDFDDIEVLMPVHSRLMAPVLAPGQVLSGFLLHKVFKDKPVYIRPMRTILDMEPSFKKAKHDSEVS